MQSQRIVITLLMDLVSDQIYYNERITYCHFISFLIYYVMDILTKKLTSKTVSSGHSLIIHLSTEHGYRQRY